MLVSRRIVASMPVPQYLQSLQQPEPPTPPPAGDPDPLGLGVAAGAGSLGGSPEHWEGCDWTNPLDDAADFRGQLLPRSPGNQVSSPVRRGPAGSLLLSQCQSPVQPRLLPFHEEGEGKGLCGPRPGLPSALSPSRGVLSFIAAGVENGCLERQLRASRLPIESQPAVAGGKGFEVSSLGVSAAPFSSVTKSSGSTAPIGRSAPADCARTAAGMQYIHIPEHALRDFRTFARNATQQACNDYAIKNPYAQALRRHREELEQNKVVPVAATDPTLEQRLATEREALCQLQDSPSPKHAGTQGLWCRPDDGRGRRCIAPEGACCAEESSPPAKLKSSEAALVYPLPIPDDFGSPSAGHCPLSARSFSSTTCSRHSNSNSEELKQGGETISGC